jgi:hypothetical protein
MGKAVGAALAGAACLMLLAPLAGASSRAAFADPAGDALATAPDLTSVQVSNDDAGTIVFRISIPNRTTLDDPDLVALLVDADGNVRTGCARGTFGAEYALDVLARKYVFGRCEHGQWDFTHKPASFRGSFSGSTLTLQANRRDLGSTRAFAFRVGAAATTAEDAAYDFAPNTGTSAWTYKVVAPTQSVRKPAKHRRPRRAPVRLHLR